jgi:sensor histidine kinase YesM
MVEISNFSPDLRDVKTLGGFGIGISNTRERLKCLYGAAAKIELLESDNIFTARLWIPV